MVEVLPYLGGLAGALASVGAESSCWGWFGGTVATMAMVGDCVGFNVKIFANPPVFVLFELNICAGAAVKKLQCLGSGNSDFRALNAYAGDADGLSVVVGCFRGSSMGLLSGKLRNSR